jgi:hypothetical protein
MRAAAPLCAALALLCVSARYAGAADDRYEPDLSTPEAALSSSLYAARNRLAGAYLDTQADWIRRQYGSDRASQIRGLRDEWEKHDFPPGAEIRITGVEFGDYADYQAVVSYDEVRTAPNGQTLTRHVHAAMALEDRLWRVKYAFVDDPPIRAPGTEPYSSEKSIKDAETVHWFR